MDKKDISEKMLQIRNGISFAERKMCDEQIADQVMQIAKDKEQVAIYASFRGEVATDALISTLLMADKEVYCPRIEAGDMNFYRVKSIDDFIMGHFNVMEPTSSALIQPDALDLIIIPMLAFNRQGYRVGYGKGYYDRYLPKTRALKVGVAYALQEVNDRFEESHDIACDVIVTEKERIEPRES